jgi:hypothetical protein
MSSILRTQARAAGRWTRKSTRRYAPVRLRAAQREEVAHKAMLARLTQRPAHAPLFIPKGSTAAGVVAALTAILKGARGR